MFYVITHDIMMSMMYLVGMLVVCGGWKCSGMVVVWFPSCSPSSMFWLASVALVPNLSVWSNSVWTGWKCFPFPHLHNILAELVVDCW